MLCSDYVLSQTSSSGFLNNINGGLQRASSGWIALVIAGLSIAVIIIAICYMIGEATGLANIKAFAKQEVYELVTSIVIIAILVASLYAYGQFAQKLADTNMFTSTSGSNNIIINGMCPDKEKIYDKTDRPEAQLFASTDFFLGCTPSTKDPKLTVENLRKKEINPNSKLYDDLWEAQASDSSKGIMLGHMMDIYLGLFSLEFILGPISTFGVSTYLPEPIVSSISFDIAPVSGLTPISEALVMLTDLVGVGLVTIMVQKVLLQYVYHNALSVFLPLGIGFRAIPFLRKTGATIIAATLVMYFIFPISIWINQQIYFNSFFEYDNTTGHYKTTLVDWTNYHSILQIYSIDKEGKNYQEYERELLEKHIKPFYKETAEAEDIIIDEVHGTEYKDMAPEDQISSLIKSLWNSGNTVIIQYFLNWGSILGPVLPMEYLFTMIVDMFTTSMQWFVINLLFLANTIILSITFFKDLSIAIGGEPRIFGMSKLL